MAVMNLFVPIVKESELHPNFKHVLHKNRVAERNEVLRWAEDFPDRDGKFVQQFQTTFNSSFWELYLHAIFKEYHYDIDWSHASPDFLVNSDYGQFVVEASTANAANGKLSEWEKILSAEELNKITSSWLKFNTEGIIRLSNTFISKWKYYREKYSSLPHVKDKPFLLALAPFEQPHFELQYNRPIVALLYDYYVDEDSYLKAPELFPDGVPSKQLNFVTKENGAKIELGLFNDDRCSDISAVIFSCTATWGKVSALSDNQDVLKIINWTWARESDGWPEVRTNKDHKECLTDGLQIFHNPYAKHPLSPEIFRRKGVLQYFRDLTTNDLIIEESTRCMYTRHVQNLHLK